jgi:hypothetical protein
LDIQSYKANIRHYQSFINSLIEIRLQEIEHVITLSVFEACVEWSAILTDFKWDRNSAHLTQHPIRVVGCADVFRGLPMLGFGFCPGRLLRGRW